MSAAPSRYDLLEKLGEGGAGSVYKAWDKRLQRYVAIKRLHPAEQREGDGVGTNLIKEAAALSSLQHPNIVSVYDLDEIDGEACVVMEFLNGETLEQTMRRGALNLVDFGSVARQSLEGLVAAHRLGVQHRDIKPSNFMVNWLPNGDFLVKMLDFGLADFSSRPHQQVSEGESETYGSVHFMAPEQFLRHPVDVRTDLYSLGCVLYYALTAKYPFDGRTMEEIINAHLRTIPTPVQEMRGDVSSGLSEWVAWLMSRDAQHRPQSAEEALDMFQQVLAGKVTTLGKSRMLKTQQVVKPITTAVRPSAGPGPATDRPAVRTSSVPTRPTPKPPAPGATTSQKAAAVEPPAKTPAQAAQRKKLLLIAGITTAVIALGIVGAIISQQKPAPVAEAPLPPPVSDPVLWARADRGLKTDKARRDAKLGDGVDYWSDNAPLDGENPLHYINTTTKESERQLRLPHLVEVTLGTKTFPVLNFNGKNSLLIATPSEDKGEISIPNSTAANSFPELTYGLICRVAPEPQKMILVAGNNDTTKVLWELYVEQQNLCLGSPGKVASVPIPPGTEFMGVLMTVSTPKKEGQIFVSFGKADLISSPVVKGLAVSSKVDRVRLGAVAASSGQVGFKGDIAEVHLYQRLLTPADRTAFQQYFQKRYVP